ncbi:MAG: type II toxin-antitoxin system Phd/YefM family antitoxin [Candidatus Undinarchaeales archaeon]|jgi:prevent-host-death family protein|nr:type II toxin-antitoxin system Phd/YefM family antitoxin [Candidatus Undinarchaeales archaeon]MDP7494080.1 type II toxin-antitoxin system Phd/YefM family antitoxin [Candidatus Undinarchaeales archaeon]
MVIIKPISDLRNHFNEISELCHKEGEPVYITKNGKGDLVVMSLARYEEHEALLELYQKLSIAEEQSSSKEGRKTHKEMMALLRKRLNA